MTLVKYSPSRKQFGFPNVFDEFFGRDISKAFGQDWTNNIPSVNITENDEQFNIDVAAPGYEKSQLNISVEDQVLTISAEQEEKKTAENDKVNRREFNFGSFKRTFKLPKEVNEKKIDASYINGILHVTLPKSVKEKAVRSIKIG